MIETSEIQVPSFKITIFFKSSANIDRNGIGITLIIIKVFKIIFVFAVNKGRINSHTAIVEIITIKDHDKFLEVK